MRVPQWLTLLIALTVIGFGAYRIYLSLRAAPAAEPESPATPTTRTQSRSLFAGGFYRMGKRTHLFVGIIYLLLGTALVLTSFGWNPLGDTFGPATETPSKDNAPTKGGVPVDRIPNG